VCERARKGFKHDFLGEKRKSFKQDSPTLNQRNIKMEKSSKPLTRDALTSMQVIDAKGRLVGKVKDVAFSVGKMGISLTVETEDGEIQSIEWEDVQAAADFIILKAVQQQAVQTQPTYQAQQPVQTAAQPAQQQSTQPMCPTCGRPLTWIPQYQRWYCYNDKKYV
jgi:sporulation protein YlmC with PRC-barrel domain